MVEPAPFPPRSLEVPGIRFPVTVIEGQNTSQLIEGVHLLDHQVLLPELFPLCYPGGNGGYMAVISLCPSLSHCSAEVSHCHFLPWYEHVTLITPGVEERYLVEDHHGDLRITFHERQT